MTIKHALSSSPLYDWPRPASYPLRARQYTFCAASFHEEFVHGAKCAVNACASRPVHGNWPATSRPSSSVTRDLIGWRETGTASARPVRAMRTRSLMKSARVRGLEFRSVRCTCYERTFSLSSTRLSVLVQRPLLEVASLAVDDRLLQSIADCSSLDSGGGSN